LIANVRWARVRNEFIFQNADADDLNRITRTVYLPGFIHDARVIWFYVFVFFITLRLGNPMHELWFASEKARSCTGPGSQVDEERGGARDARGPSARA
jgi:hypothetical protein